MYAKGIIIGWLGQDVEVRTTTSGMLVGSANVATIEKRNGQDATTWYKVTFFRKLAEIAQQYAKKGTLVYIEGELSMNDWTGKDGVKHVQPEIRVSTLKLLGGKGGSKQKQERPADPWEQAARDVGFVPETDDEDVPL